MMVNFWCMRHGEKDGEGNITERGLRQVEMSARAHLSDVKFDVILHSPAQRAEDSARRAQTALNLSCPVVRFPAFGSFLAQDEATPQVSIKDAYARIGKPHAKITVYDWLEYYNWPAGYLRGMMRAAMVEAVLYLQTNPVMRDQGVSDLDPVNVLVCGHSPHLEMATAIPRTRFSLNEADIIRYMVEFDEFGFAHSVGEMGYECPPVE